MANRPSNAKSYYLVTFRDAREGKNVELKVRRISDSPLGLGFICLAEFFFDLEKPIVQPIEEQMRKRFESVKTLHLSIYSIISIEEIGPPTMSLRFKKDRSNLVAFPNPNGPN
jgi:hypothetical protein